MRACSLSPALKIVLFLGFFSLIRGIVHGQAFTLPDLVIIRDAEPDIPLPNQFPDLAATWKPVPPRYRRQYGFPLENYLEAPKSLPGDLLPIDSATDLGALELPETAAYMESEPLQPGSWGASAAMDIREGVDSDLGHMLGGIGEIGTAVFISSSEASSRPWFGEVGLMKNDLLSATAKIGLKEEYFLI